MKTRVLTALTILAAGCSHSTPTPPDTTKVAAKPAEPAPRPQPAPPTPAPAPPTPPSPPPPAPVEFKDVFPGVRVDAAHGTVEIDGEIPFNPLDSKTPITYLEVFACRPDTREHETVVMSRALPSHVHAALLLAGASAGSPGKWMWKDERLSYTPPTGSPLAVTIAWTDVNGAKVEKPLADMALHAINKRSLAMEAAGERFVFAGSAFMKVQGKETYAADVSGTIVGLCTFGDEPIAWTGVYSPEASVQEPEWVFNSAALPPTATKVVIRVVVENPR